MSSTSTSDVHRIFESLDHNQDGVLSLDELVWLLEKTGVHVSEDEVASLVGNDGMSFDEFSCFYDAMFKNGNVGSGLLNESEDQVKEDEADNDLYKAFKVFDLNGDGLISSQELHCVLCQLGMWDTFGGLDCDKIISKFDVNSDGFVDFCEFKTMMLAH